ncbi:Glycerol-3-phosphate acyltransferase, chloroplastic [Chlamydiales bacterium SCGC AG-110-P3]|nr:Glycerol-3-phosphate acyltransferase, chloroplastic [Chlamydiales bacterium SCGC AG-110-P3]
MPVAEEIKNAIDSGILSPTLGASMQKFYQNYSHSALGAHGSEHTNHVTRFRQYLQHVMKQVEEPFGFGHYHEMLRTPCDYHAFGMEFFRSLVNAEKSRVEGIDNIKRIEKQLSNGENVFLLSNHQTECDPQLMSLLLEDKAPKLAQRIIFVAGHRVTHDPMAVPFSLGVNLFCIFSKKHIEHPPEKRAEKLLHNQRTMKRMRNMLTAGGACIYIAPSGGRDRPGSSGRFPPAPFNAPSLEMTILQGKQVPTPTHYYPLALWTYPILPPPDAVHRELGEKRITGYSPIYMTFGDELTIDNYPGNDNTDKRIRRQARAEHVHSILCTDYDKMDAMASDEQRGSK